MSSLLDWLVQNEPSFRINRLPSLYSDLAIQKTSNPDGYTANVTTWQAALIRAAISGQLQGGRLVLQTSGDLLNDLSSPKYGMPSGLGIVIDEGVRSGKMIDKREFLATEKSIYSKSWVPSPLSILRWSLQQIGLTGSVSYNVSGQLRAGNLVLVPALEQVSKQVLASQEKRGQTLTNRIVTRESFAQDLESIGLVGLSSQDVQVLLRFLHRDKQALSYNEQTVKFKSPISSTPEPITAEDTAIASLKSLISSLGEQISVLNGRIATLKTTAFSSVKTGNKAAALSALRSKKLAEKTFQQRTDTLHQLEEVYSKIEQAADQADAVRIMEASAGVLRALNQKVGGVEAVEDVVERLREEMEKVDEVGQVLADPLDPRVVLDESDIDDELEVMEKEEKRAREEKEAEATRKRFEELEIAERERERKRKEEEAAKEALESSLHRQQIQQREQEQQQQQQQQQPVATEDSLEESMKKLSGISLEDGDDDVNKVSAANKPISVPQMITEES